MVLRVSAEATGNKGVDVKAVMGGDYADDCGIEHARVLTDFAEAICTRDPQQIAATRNALVEARRLHSGFHGRGATPPERRDYSCW